MNKRLKQHLIWNAVMFPLPGAGSVALECINWANPDLFNFDEDHKSTKKAK
jgi:hypothetical protein